MKNFFCIKSLAVFVILFGYANCNVKNINAADFNNYDNDAEMSYNIFTAETWDLSMYAYFGYAFAWMPYFNKNGLPYRQMLRNGHHGIAFGGGVAINKNVLFGLSFANVSKNSRMRGEFADRYKEISWIRSHVFMTNVDVGVRLPMWLISLDSISQDLFKKDLYIYVVGGFNIISASLTNSYSDEYDTIPVSIAKTPRRVSLGMNFGIALTYNFLSWLHLRTEVRKMFILTRKLSLPSDSWLFNVGIGVSF